MIQQEEIRSIVDEEDFEDEFFEVKLIHKHKHDQAVVEGEISRPMLISSSGGGGHIAAANALTSLFDKAQLDKYQPVPYEQKVSTLMGLSIFTASQINNFESIQSIIEALNLPVLPDHVKLRRAINQLKSDTPRYYIDMLLDVYPTGYENAAIWNTLQREDKKNELTKLVALQAHNDRAFSDTVYNHYLKLLLDADNQGRPYTEIISTQVIGLKALCKAVKKYNELKHKNIKIHQYVTDLPTKGATHFFNALTGLKPAYQQQMNLYAVGMNKDIIDHYFPQGQAFNGLYDLEPKDNPMIRPGFYDPANDNSQNFDKEVTLHLKDQSTHAVHPHEKIATIMLGSQGGDDPGQYIPGLLQNGMDKIFIFGGGNEDIAKKIRELPCYPENAGRIVLLDKQDDPFIAEVMTRSNVLIIRSGGLSVMEQMAMNHNEEQVILIHHADAETEELQSGIAWEDCNAEEMIKSLDNIRVEKTSPSRCFRQIRRLLNTHAADMADIEQNWDESAGSLEGIDENWQVIEPAKI